MPYTLPNSVVPHLHTGGVRLCDVDVLNPAHPERRPDLGAGADLDREHGGDHSNRRGRDHIGMQKRMEQERYYDFLSYSRIKY